LGNQDLKHELPGTIMNTQPSSELPPVDFVAFLAQRAGLSQEDAEHRLERWLGEYHASTNRRPPARFASPHSLRA
jgi:hypothetical protein